MESAFHIIKHIHNIRNGLFSNVVMEESHLPIYSCKYFSIIYCISTSVRRAALQPVAHRTRVGQMCP